MIVGLRVNRKEPEPPGKRCTGFLWKMGLNRNWTKQEEEYLIENWGTFSVATIAKNLGRTENAVVVRKCRLGLGAFLDNGDYITWNQLQIAIGKGKSGNGYKMISWVKNRDFPIHTKKVNNNSFKIVYLDEWWEWAEKNKDLLDFSKFEENILGEEPEWVKEKRKHDFEKSRKYIMTPWTKTEDDKLKYLVSKQKYSYDELSKMLRRTATVCVRRDAMKCPYDKNKDCTEKCKHAMTCIQRKERGKDGR